MRVHIKENLYNRTGMKDTILVHALFALFAPMTDIFATRRDAVLLLLPSKIPDNYPITDVLDKLTT